MIAIASITFLLGTGGAIAVQSSLAECDEEDDSTELILQVVDLQEEPPADVDEDDVDEDEGCTMADDEDTDDLEVADAELENAMDHYHHGDFLAARSSALRLEGSEDFRMRAKALRLDGAASCLLGDSEGVLAAWQAMDNAWDRDFVRFVCSQNGIKTP